MQLWPASVPAQHVCAAPGLCPEGVTWLMGMFPRGRAVALGEHTAGFRAQLTDQFSLFEPMTYGSPPVFSPQALPC